MKSRKEREEEEKKYQAKNKIDGRKQARESEAKAMMKRVQMCRLHEHQLPFMEVGQGGAAGGL